MKEKVDETFRKIQTWLTGSENEQIAYFFRNDEPAYQELIRLMDRCARNGWDHDKSFMLDFADEDDRVAAEWIYLQAVAYRRSYVSV
ncbi:hypothetical protein [Alkalicoccus luteus]|uniref:Uncharacterized protein n=1 Tax=Alkalicoccus luteus TaxID=1237094 RepID=A0A969PWZ7_9BACI|nr:hypothetical protein [Alkalicoccus luteus]NJP37172.1 hypothetical protein [Alkalicoccus luteus]